MAITTYADLIKRNQSGATSNSNYSPYKDKIDNGVRDGSTQYSPSSQYTPSTNTPTQSTPSSSSSSSSVNTKDPNNNPYGENGFWDAADGWKQKAESIAGDYSKTKEISDTISNYYNQLLDEARRQEEERQNRVRSAINAGYDAVDSGLNDLASRLPTQAQDYNDQIASQYNSSTGKFDTARTYANDQIDQNQKTTLNDLSDRLKSSLQAANTYLGSAGASNSSANERYSTALLKQANKQQGNVMSQADTQRAQVQKTYDDNMAQLEEWQNSKLYEVKQWLTEQKNQIDREKINASSERAQALANLEANLHQVAMQRVSDIENQANTWKNNVNAWMIEQSANTLNGVNLLNSTPQALSWEDFSGFQLGNRISNGQTTGSTLGGYTTGNTDEDKVGTSRITI